MGVLGRNTNRKDKETLDRRMLNNLRASSFKEEEFFLIVGKLLNGPVERDSSNMRSVHSLREPGITQSIIAMFTKSRHS